MPVYLKPLVWINRPLVERPAIVRKVLGGAAIVTLFNALAVLTYVLVFKREEAVRKPSSLQMRTER